VRLAFPAALRREDDPRLRAAVRACLERDAWEAAECPFLFRAFEVALDRLEEGVRREWLCPLRKSLSAFWRVLADVLPLRGGDNLTPERRAFESPIAIAGFVEAAPCLPSRM
jgi:hypothetical protein